MYNLYKIIQIDDYVQHFGCINIKHMILSNYFLKHLQLSVLYIIELGINCKTSFLFISLYSELF